MKIACLLFLIKFSIFSNFLYFILFLLNTSFIFKSSQIVMPRLFQLLLIILLTSFSARFGNTYLQLLIAILFAVDNFPKVLKKKEII